MQNGSSRSRKFIKIPGDDIFIHTFKFNTNLPLPPIPYAKTLYYPLDAERYSKPKITSFHLRNIAPLLTKCDLGIPVDQINMKSYLYNGSEIKGECKLDEEDEMIITENIVKVENDDNDQKEESDRTEEREEPKEEENSDFFDEKTSFSPIKARAKVDENDLNTIVDNTFNDINTAHLGMSHPKKAGVVCKKIYDILPNFNDINIELICIGDENLKSKMKNERYIIQSVSDLDKQEIFKVYDHIPMEPRLKVNQEEDEMKFEHKDDDKMIIEHEDIKSKILANPIENLEQNIKTEETLIEQHLNKFEVNKEYDFRHVGNYMFTKNLTSDIKRDYLLSFHTNEEKAYVYELKANFFIRKNKYTNETKRRQSCINLNVDNLNKSDLIEMKNKLARINIKTREIQEKIDNFKEIEEKQEKLIKDEISCKSENEAEEKKNESKMEIEINKDAHIATDTGKIDLEDVSHSKDEKIEKEENKIEKKEEKIEKKEDKNDNDSDEGLFSPEKSDDESSQEEKII